MPEAWDITTGDNRIENSIETYIIFCEDQNDEPYYFRSFEVAHRVKINCIPNQKKTKLNLVNTLVYCQNEGLVDYINHTYKLKEGITKNIWCVYDRDMEYADVTQLKQHDDLSFTTAIDIAKQAGVNVAWSNDAFELWILLHFELVPADNKLHRNYIYNRLTNIFQLVPAIHTAYESLIKSGTFSYKTHLKKRLAFLKFVLPMLKQRTTMAINNGIVLEANFVHTIPYHDCNPCTMVHHLITGLLAVSSSVTEDVNN